MFKHLAVAPIQRFDALCKIERYIDDHVFLTSGHTPASQFNQNLPRIDPIALRRGLRMSQKAGIHPRERR